MTRDQQVPTDQQVCPFLQGILFYDKGSASVPLLARDVALMTRDQQFIPSCKGCYPSFTSWNLSREVWKELWKELCRPGA